jgi:hypothetical protein
MGKACSSNGGKNACTILFEKPGIETLGSPRCRRENNIKMDLRDIELVVWTGPIWLRIGTSGGLF